MLRAIIIPLPIYFRVVHGVPEGTSGGSAYEATERFLTGSILTSRRRGALHDPGWVASSNVARKRSACSALALHISSDGLSPTQTAGRSGLPNNRQRLSVVSCTQRTPAGLPLGIPGMGELIEGAMQHAPQPVRHASEVESRHPESDPVIASSLSLSLEHR
jgi:hypothetical protein